MHCVCKLPSCLDYNCILSLSHVCNAYVGDLQDVRIPGYLYRLTFIHEDLSDEPHSMAGKCFPPILTFIHSHMCMYACFHVCVCE